MLRAGKESETPPTFTGRSTARTQSCKTRGSGLESCMLYDCHCSFLSPYEFFLVDSSYCLFFLNYFPTDVRHFNPKYLNKCLDTYALTCFCLCVSSGGPNKPKVREFGNVFIVLLTQTKAPPSCKSEFCSLKAVVNRCG